MRSMSESNESKLKSAKDMLAVEVGEVRLEANTIITSLELEVERLMNDMNRTDTELR